MAKHLVVKTGDDPLTKPLLEYLTAQYGIPADDIRRVQLDSEVGKLQVLTVTLLVRGSIEPEEPAEPEPPAPPLFTDPDAVMPRGWNESGRVHG